VVLCSTEKTAEFSQSALFVVSLQGGIVGGLAGTAGAGAMGY